MVDAQGNLYLHESVNSSRTMTVVHRFDSTGQCVGTWDVTGKGFRIDPGGYVYTFTGGTLVKSTPDWGETLYTRQMPGPIRGIEFMPASSDFMLAGTDVGGGSTRMEFHGMRIELLNIVGSPLQDPTTFQLRTDDLALLATCDASAVMMEGVIADGVSPLLLRWKVPGPGQVQWSLENVSPPLLTLLGTLTSLDSSEVDQVGIQVPVIEISDPGSEDHAFFGFAVYTAPTDFDRVTSDGDSTSRHLQVTGRYFPQANPSPDMETSSTVRVERPPILAVHGLWSDASVWRSFRASQDEAAWQDRWWPMDYAVDHGERIEVNAPSAVLDPWSFPTLLCTVHTVCSS